MAFKILSRYYSVIGLRNSRLLFSSLPLVLNSYLCSSHLWSAVIFGSRRKFYIRLGFKDSTFQWGFDTSELPLSNYFERVRDRSHSMSVCRPPGIVRKERKNIKEDFIGGRIEMSFVLSVTSGLNETDLTLRKKGDRTVFWETGICVFFYLEWW